MELYRIHYILFQGNSHSCFYNLGKEAKEDWKYTESFKQLISPGGYAGTFHPPAIQMFQKIPGRETLAGF